MSGQLHAPTDLPILTEKHERKGLLVRPKRRWKKTTKMVLKVVGYDDEE
jgi:hypothetical protein